MTRKEQKDLLLKDLCGRFPYGVKIDCFTVPRTVESITIDHDGFVTIDCGGEHFYHPFSNILHKDCLPYLRPMSSMTEEEIEELKSKCIHTVTEEDWEGVRCDSWGIEIFERYDTKRRDNPIWLSTINMDAIDWLLKNHFDFRGLIEKGLALEAPEGMY